MPRARLLTHPVLVQKRSITIFFSFLSAAVVVGGVLLWNMNGIVERAGINMYVIPSDGNVWLKLLLSNIVRGAVILITVAFSAGLTSKHVLGPVKRIEQWLQDLDAGHDISALKVRSADEYEKLVKLINELYEKAKTKNLK